VVVDAKIVVAHPKGGNAPAVAAGDGRLAKSQALRRHEQIRLPSAP
jgi:hypothetical protein